MGIGVGARITVAVVADGGRIECTAWVDADADAGLALTRRLSQAGVEVIVQGGVCVGRSCLCLCMHRLGA